MPVDQIGTWRAVAERWHTSGGIASFLVLPVAEVAPALAALAEYGWWLDRFALADLVADGESTSDSTPDYGYCHLFFRRAPGRG